MYGQFQTSDGGYGLARPFVSESDMRAQFDGATPKFPVHIMTFRAGVYQAIRFQDPELRCLKTERGEWFFHAQDVALMRALFLSAGFDRVRYNDRVLYYYRNSDNPLSQAADHRAGLIADCNILALKPRLKRIERY